MKTEEWKNRQLHAADQLLNQGGQALRQGQVQAAEPLLLEASAVLDMVEEPSLDYEKLQAQLFNEIGFVRQRQERFEEAEKYHQQAVDACESLLAKGVDFEANTTATLINLAGVFSQKGDFVSAKQVNARAVELAESMLDNDPDVNQFNLVFGAHQNYAVIAAKGEDLKTADEAMEKAMDVLERAPDELKKHAAVQVAQGAQQLSVLMFESSDYERAVRWGEVAEESSELAYEVRGQQVLPVYVTSQINLIYFHERTGAYASAEDALFKALEVVGDNEEILQRGKQFYESCRKQADTRLEEGNLPRDEVEEGYNEILARLERAQASSTDS